jgi:hypothetical protein
VTFYSVEDAMAHHRRKMLDHEPMLRVDIVKSDIRTWFIASFGQYLWLDDCPLLAASKVTSKTTIDKAIEQIAEEDQRAVNARVDGLIDPPAATGGPVL